MKHLFVPYELAKQLKEKGFDEKCYAHYNTDGKNELILNETPVRGMGYNTQAPLYQQVVDWFREKHGMILDPSYAMSEENYAVIIFFNNSDRKFESFGNYKSYYGALTKAIEEALKLI